MNTIELDFMERLSAKPLEDVAVEFTRSHTLLRKIIELRNAGKPTLDTGAMIFDTEALYKGLSIVVMGRFRDMRNMGETDLALDLIKKEG